MRILTLAWESPGSSAATAGATAALLQAIAGRGDEVALVLTSADGPRVLTGLRVLTPEWAAAHPPDGLTPPASRAGVASGGPAQSLYPAGGPPLMAEMACVA